MGDKVEFVDKRAQAQQKLEEEMKKAIDSCWDEIMAILDKHGFRFIVTTVIRPDQTIVQNIDLAPKQ